MPDGPVSAKHHDVFLSYSRTDEAFAVRLEERLEAFKPPADLAVPHRRLEVFRDKEDIAGTELHGALAAYLAEAGSLVILCSPASRASPWVDQEIRDFAARKGADRVIPVMISGIPNNEAGPDDESRKAFPDALLELGTVPLAVDYRGFETSASKRVDREEWAGPWYTLLANIYGVERRDIEARDLRRRRRLRVLWASAGAGVSLALLGLTLWAWVERGRAEVNAGEAARQARIAGDNAATARANEATATRNAARADSQTVIALENAEEAERQRRNAEAEAERATNLLIQAQQVRLGGEFLTLFERNQRLRAFRALDTLGFWTDSPDLSDLPETLGSVGADAVAGIASADSTGLRDLFAQVTRMEPVPASPQEVYAVIRASYGPLVAHPQVFGAMAYRLQDLAARFEAVRPGALSTLEAMRDAYATYHGRAPPDATADEALNARRSVGPGTVMVGSDRGRLETVESFLLQEHEVTHAEYARFDPAHVVPPGQDRHPVTGVTWYQAAAYAAWLGGALPTEAQWALALQGPDGRAYPWGDTPAGDDLREGAANDRCTHAVFMPCSGRRSRPVMSAPQGATPEGIHDLAGNVWEWVGDWYDPEPAAPRGPFDGTQRVLRGGSFHVGATYLTATTRHADDPGQAFDDYGFRVAFPGGAS